MSDEPPKRRVRSELFKSDAKNLRFFDGVTRHPIDANQLLDSVPDDMQAALVIGWDGEGYFYFASSEPNGPEILWLLEMAKAKLLKAGGL